MPYIYQDTVRGSPRNALTFPTSTQEVLREQFAQTFEENPIMAVKRWNELREDHKTGPMLSAEDARQKLKDAGLENDLKVSDAGITQAALDTLMFRKRTEKKRQEIFARAEGGVAQGAARLGVAFATTLADPISAGLNFVPVVGQVRYARWLSEAGTLAGRIGVRAGVGAAEGAAGAALYEPFLYTMRTQEQADYDAADSLINVAFGGLVGSGLHSFVGNAGELYQRARGTVPQFERFKGLSQDDAVTVQRFLDTRSAMDVMDIQRVLETWTPQMRKAVEDVARLRVEPTIRDIVDAMPPEAQQATLRAAVGQAVEGRQIDIEPIIRATHRQAVHSLPGVATEVTETAEGISVGSEHGSTDAQISGPYLQVEFSATKTAKQGQGEGTARLIRLAEEAYARGLILASDATVSAQAVRQYRKLEELGFTVKQNPADLSQEGSLLSHSPQVPVFEVQGFPGARPALNDPRLAGRQIEPKGAAEYRAATEQAEATLAREVENTSEANLKAAEEEADLAVAEAKELADRLGVKMDEDADIAAINEAADKAERWARAAELATVCLVRGG